ncbi:Uncharacterised protein [Mycobacterium tuberculosis]|nr:Uncharacterised protein [Mycobacterium tuberculosis]
MICRSAVKPMFIGLGTAAILATGGASALATTTPSPSESASASPSASAPVTTGTLKVSISPTKAEAKPGATVTLLTHIEAVDGDVSGIRIESIAATPETADPTVVSDCASGCDLGALASGKALDDDVVSKVSVPGSTNETVTVTVIVTADGLDELSEKATITYGVTEPPASQTPTPTTSPPKKPTKKPTSRTPTKPSPSPTPTKPSGGTSGSGNSGGSGSGGGSTSGGTGGYVPPSPNSSFESRGPQVALPPIQAPSPSVAPSPVPGSVTPQSRLQGNKAPVAQDVTFERMASTQIAWLAALLVAFSLLLTQLRLGRRRMPAGAAAKRAKGSHRRPRRGIFGK